MPRVDLVVESKISRSSRARQLEGMFDVPASTKSRREWHAELPIEGDDWSIGLIVGPSGSGKTQVARKIWGKAVDVPLKWKAASVIDDFSKSLSIEDITKACSAVGFNTIPAWLRPYAVLSNGEKFRVELARRILELPDPIVVDEFTSVVDRQVAKVASHAIQKFARRQKRRLVAVTCHYDVIDWLQPDWIFEPASGKFRRRHLQRRPTLDVAICRIPNSAWEVFAPFHYLTGHLHRSARCWGLFVNGSLAAFTSMLPRPTPAGTDREIKGFTRTVTLPDYQGLGLTFILKEKVASAVVALGYRARAYPAHSGYVRAHDQSPMWRMTKRPGSFNSSNRVKANQVQDDKMLRTRGVGAMGGTARPNAVFEYVGPAMEDLDQAVAIYGPETRTELSSGRSNARFRVAHGSA